MRRQASAPLPIALLLAACTSAAPPADDRAPEGDAATTAQVSAPLEAAPVDAEPSEPAPPCPAAVADVPTPLFDDTVLIRPPVGVELVEMTPGLARSLAPTGSACDRVVTRMLVGLSEDEPARPLTDLRDQALAAADLPPEAITWTATHERPNRLEGAYAARANPGGSPPARGWFVIARMNGVVAWAQIEAGVADFDALAPTLKASGEHLLIIPRG